jgi:Protein of unknown function (DUF3891)
MIVRRFADRLQLITQPDHAHLAGTIMERCVSLGARPRRDSILRAVYAHDNGWQEEDEAPGVNPGTGEILDFVSAPLSVRHAVWPRGVARVGDDAWTAALIAQHAVTVYDRFRSDAAWTSFFSNMEAERDSRLAASGLPLDELVDDYQYVRLGDLISLTFCTGWTGEQRFREYVVHREGTRVVVFPDLLGGAEIPISITGREIRDRQFQSDAELREALQQASAVTLRGIVSGR